MYLFRLDDASYFMDVEKWNKIEELFDKYGVKPIVGIIPHNEDEALVSKYAKDEGFWDKARTWKEKGWRIALHGYNHAFITQVGGVNPVNKKSEFAGVPLDVQRQKIRDGYKILCDESLKPDVFFAPAHTFDENTLTAIKEESDIRIISDTIANDVYFKDGFYYIPQQTGKASKRPFKLTTICIHPNSITDKRLDNIQKFIKTNSEKMISADVIEIKDRKKSLYDIMLNKSIMFLRKLR